MMKDREFEKFHGGPATSSRDRLHITVSRGGRLYFNRNTFKLLGEPEAVNLYFKRSKETIGVEPTSPRLAEAFPVRVHPDGCTVFASTFFGHFDIFALIAPTASSARTSTTKAYSSSTSQTWPSPPAARANGRSSDGRISRGSAR